MKRIVFPKRQDSKLDEARNGSGNIQFRFPKVKMPVRQESGIHASRQNRMEGALPYEKLSGIPYHYIKYALAAVLLIFVILDMVNDPVSSAKIDTVAENVVKAAEFQGMEVAEARMVKRFYGLNPKDYEGAVLYAPIDNMDAHEMLLVKLKDSSQKKQVQDAILERLDTQLKSFQGYGAEQTALLNKHVLLERGNFVLYVVGEHASDAQEAFVKSL
ncbi:DUF4358 domain-containing protein [Lachnospiraceae bacterium]|jgi:hypothetical protein|nr:DUF4358 domain-containing protein [uncultured Schaedlerella sp.]MCI9153002.1 DUF4358 domain-containing protein [Ruminococcus sp.]NBI57519.1 DUF4358 domain-containing protein [Lachnospiraceae bacterium]